VICYSHIDLKFDGLLMERREVGQQIDRLLLPFLQAINESESQRLVAQLVSDHADPIIKNIIRHKMHVSVGRSADNRSSEDAEEMHSEIVVQLLSRLSEFKEKPDDKYINNFRSYVAAISYSAWHEHLRRRYPQRHMLKNKLRYLLTHRPSFAVWEAEDKDWLCGLAAWGKQTKGLAGNRRIQELRGGPEASERAGLSSHVLKRLDLASLLGAIFKYTGSCVNLDELVNLVAEWTAVHDQTPQTTIEEDVGDPLEQLPDPRPRIDVELQQRTYLRRLWVEICQLKPQQRAALLLNLKDSDGGDVVSVFPIAGIATLRDIADALVIQPEELAKIWNDLPLDDLTIASHLGITRQQVINLRKCARERLARRMKAY
jgi:DNA-directed RNA polymerase specialized sigma24 family protein